MSRFPALLLLISALLLSGCSAEKAVVRGNVSVENRYFSNASRDYVYRANIGLGGHSLTGILAARKIDAEVHRIVLTTDFGNTLLDMEIGPTHEKINYLTENLNRNIVRKTLVSDFRLLFSPRCLSDGMPQDAPFPCEWEASKTSFAQRDSNGYLVQLISGSRRNPRVRIAFEPENDTFAHKITISHGNIPLEIELLTINQP